MADSYQRECSHCGTPLPASSPGGHCPKCLLGFASGVESADLASDELLSSSQLRYFGDYELESEIARGGMGVVYRARQVSLNRPVAIKMILAGQLATPDAITRFKIEAEAAANLDHPHIVPVYEIGEHELQHYFSMKLVEDAEDASQWATSRAATPVGIREIAVLLEKVSRAIAYAHERGVLHRDVKPSNILVDGAGEPQLTDFGLAKLLNADQSLLTLTSTGLGSPAYMAPEQAQGGATLSSDVYGIGAVLFTMLTGEPPFQGATALETIRLASEQPPRPPKSLNAGIPDDLQTVCLKCLEKEPAKRYASARELADDLGRFAKGEPVSARPVGVAGQLRRWCRRNPALSALSAALVLAFVLGFAGVAWQWQRAEKSAVLAGMASEDAKQKTAELARTLARTDERSAARLLDENEPDRALAHLARALRTKPSSQSSARAIVAILSDWQFEWRVPEPIVAESQMDSFELNRNREQLRVSVEDKLALWDVAEWRALDTREAHDFDPAPREAVAPPTDPGFPCQVARPASGIGLVGLSEDTRKAAWWGEDGEHGSVSFNHPILDYAHRPEDDAVIFLSGTSPDLTHSVYRRSDGERLSSESIEAHSFLRPEWMGPEDSAPPILPVITPFGSVLFYRWATGELEYEHGFAGWYFGQMSPDGTRCVFYSSEFTISGLDLLTMEWWHNRSVIKDVTGFSFSPDGGKFVAITRHAESVRAFDAGTGSELVQRRPIVGDSQGHFWGADCKSVVFGRGDTVFKRNVDPSYAIDQQIGGACVDAGYSPGGRWIVAIETGSNKLVVWDATDLAGRREFGEGYSRASVGSNGKLVAGIDRSGGVTVWNLENGEEVAKIAIGGNPIYAAFSPRSDRLAILCNSTGDQTEVVVVSLPSGETTVPATPLSMARMREVAFLADGDQLVIHGVVGAVRFDTRSQQEFPLPVNDLSEGGGVDQWGAAVALTPDRTRVGGAATHSRNLRVMDASRSDLLAELRADTEFPYSIAFTPDGRGLVLGSESQFEVWDWEGQRRRFAPAALGFEYPHHVSCATGSPLIALSGDSRKGRGVAGIWNIETGFRVGRIIARPSLIHRIEFHPDGSQFLYSEPGDGGGLWVRHLLPPDDPVPSWLPDLADAIARQTLDADGNSQPIDTAHREELFDRLATMPGNSGYARWVRWQLESGDDKTINPLSKQTREEWANAALERGGRTNLDAVLRVFPNRTDAVEQLGQWFEQVSPPPVDELVHIEQALRTEQARWASRYHAKRATRLESE